MESPETSDTFTIGMYYIAFHIQSVFLKPTLSYDHCGLCYFVWRYFWSVSAEQVKIKFVFLKKDFE